MIIVTPLKYYPLTKKMNKDRAFFSVFLCYFFGNSTAFVHRRSQTACCNFLLIRTKRLEILDAIAIPAVVKEYPLAYSNFCKYKVRSRPATSILLLDESSDSPSMMVDHFILICRNEWGQEYDKMFYIFTTMKTCKIKERRKAKTCIDWFNRIVKSHDF